MEEAERSGRQGLAECLHDEPPLGGTVPRTVPTRRYARITAAAKRYDVSERTIRRWGADGDITLYRIGPKLVRVDLDEIDRLIRRIPAAGGGDAA
jgi:excisionase family DNA binding protein